MSTLASFVSARPRPAWRGLRHPRPRARGLLCVHAAAAPSRAVSASPSGASLPTIRSEERRRRACREDSTRCSSGSTRNNGASASLHAPSRTSASNSHSTALGSRRPPLLTSAALCCRCGSASCGPGPEALPADALLPLRRRALRRRGPVPRRLPAMTHTPSPTSPRSSRGFAAPVESSVKPTPLTTAPHTPPEPVAPGRPSAEGRAPGGCWRSCSSAGSWRCWTASSST